MNDQSLAYLYDEYAQARAEQYTPSPEDWAEYHAYLDEVGYDDGDDGEAFYDADADRGFLNLDTDCPF